MAPERPLPPQRLALAADELVAALAQSSWTLMTLPSRALCPRELVAAVEGFDAGERPAAAASAEWLRERALAEHGSARSYVFVAEHRVLAFFALSVGVGSLEPDELASLAAGARPLPAVLLAQAARSPCADLPPGAVLRYALGAAERVNQFVGVGALMLDPYDAAADRMWRARGFRPVKEDPSRPAPAAAVAAARTLAEQKSPVALERLQSLHCTVALLLALRVREPRSKLLLADSAQVGEIHSDGAGRNGTCVLVGDGHQGLNASASREGW